MIPRDVTFYEQRRDLGYNEQDTAHACMPNGSLVGYFPRSRQPESHQELWTALVRAVVDEWVAAGYTEAVA